MVKRPKKPTRSKKEKTPIVPDRIRVLFLAASPGDDGGRERLEEEARLIEQKIQAGSHRESFEFHSRWAVRISDLQEALLRHRPHIVHFGGGAGKTGGIILGEHSGGGKKVPIAALSNLFRILKDNVRIVLLNAGYTRDQAELLRDTVDYTIGINDSISNAAAIIFAAHFYQSLAFGRSVREAFDLALNELDLEGIEGSKSPELLVREGMDEKKPFLARQAAAVHPVSGNEIIKSVTPPAGHVEKPENTVGGPREPLASPQPLWRRIAGISPMIIVLSLLTFALAEVGWFQSLEAGLLNTWVRVKRKVKPDAFGPSTNITIVEITDDDYENLFDGRSPLNPAKVRELIKAIAAGNPEVIGVDLDTEAWRGFKPGELADAPPIVWTRVARKNGDVYEFSAESEAQEAIPPLWGIASVRADSVKIVRSYRRVYETALGRVPSFPLAIVRRNAATDLSELSTLEETEWGLDFSVGSDWFPSLSASEVLAAYNASKATDGNASHSRARLSELSNRIVLLGGTFSAGRDIHDTPLGLWSGVSLMAKATETELKGGHRLPNDFSVMLLGIAGSIGLVLLRDRVGRKWAAPVGLLAIAILAPLFSYFTTSTTAHWIYFLPILAVVWMRELYRHYKEDRTSRLTRL